MARPQKNNADYFPHDANMRDDRKVKALRTRHGLEGYAVWCIMLEILTDADNFTLPWDTLNQELVAGDIGIPTPQLLEIIEYLIKLQLIQHSDGQLYTIRHHQRMQPILVERERKRQWKQAQADKATAQTPAKEISDGENPQSKVKEIKGNESKEKPSNEGESNAPAHEREIQNKNFEHILKEINTWARPNNWQPLRDYAASVGYDPAQYGPVADEVKKFVTYYLDPRRHPDDRAALHANPAQYFQDKGRKWLLDAKTMNRQTPKNQNQKPKYEPPPQHHQTHHQRTNSNATGLSTIGDITGKIITEINT